MTTDEPTPDEPAEISGFPDDWSHPLVVRKMAENGGIIAELVVMPGTRVICATDGFMVEQLPMPTPPGDEQAEAVCTGVVVLEDPDVIRTALTQVNESLAAQIEKGRNRQ